MQFGLQLLDVCGVKKDFLIELCDGFAELAIGLFSLVDFLLNLLNLTFQLFDMILFDSLETFGDAGDFKVFILDSFFELPDFLVESRDGIILLLEENGLFVQLFFMLLLLEFKFRLKLENGLFEFLFFFGELVRQGVLQSFVALDGLLDGLLVEFELLIQLLNLVE